MYRTTAGVVPMIVDNVTDGQPQMTSQVHPFIGTVAALYSGDLTVKGLLESNHWLSIVS